eukprot:11727782-Alexandrium_andersonii.AAC.1
MSVQRCRSELGSPIDHISSIKTSAQACEGAMYACNIALRTMRNRSVSGTERPTSAQRPTPGSLDRPAREQLGAADREHEPANCVD